MPTCWIPVRKRTDARKLARERTGRFLDEVDVVGDLRDVGGARAAHERRVEIDHDHTAWHSAQLRRTRRCSSPFCGRRLKGHVRTDETAR